MPHRSTSPIPARRDLGIGTNIIESQAGHRTLNSTTCCVLPTWSYRPKNTFCHGIKIPGPRLSAAVNMFSFKVSRRVVSWPAELLILNWCHSESHIGASIITISITAMRIHGYAVVPESYQWFMVICVSSSAAPLNSLFCLDNHILQTLVIILWTLFRLDYDSEVPPTTI